MARTAVAVVVLVGLVVVMALGCTVGPGEQGASARPEVTASPESTPVPSTASATPAPTTSVNTHARPNAVGGGQRRAGHLHQPGWAAAQR